MINNSLSILKKYFKIFLNGNLTNENLKYFYNEGLNKILKKSDTNKNLKWTLFDIKRVYIYFNDMYFTDIDMIHMFKYSSQ